MIINFHNFKSGKTISILKSTLKNGTRVAGEKHGEEDLCHIDFSRCEDNENHAILGSVLPEGMPESITNRVTLNGTG